ncbi:MAG TPA: hypothetical protein VK870_03040 [Ignavibacteriaceae bacterium]|nr:hypothetical protein [Ignavibacteriaceae bacterium]
MIELIIIVSFFFLPVLFVLIIGCAEAQPDPAKIVTAADELDQKFFDAHIRTCKLWICFRNVYPIPVTIPNTHQLSSLSLFPLR